MFKSGVQHESLAVSDKETALATLQGMKEHKDWEGLFDVSGGKAYKAPVDVHNWELIPHGIKQLDKNKNVIWVTYSTITTNHMDMNGDMYQKKFTRHKEICTGCSKCLEIGFKKVRVR